MLWKNVLARGGYKEMGLEAFVFLTCVTLRAEPSSAKACARSSHKLQEEAAEHCAATRGRGWRSPQPKGTREASCFTYNRAGSYLNVKKCQNKIMPKAFLRLRELTLCR